MADQVTKSIIIKGNLQYVYDLWANFDNFPRFMVPIKSVEKIDDVTSHWVVEGPLGKNIEWDAITTRLEPLKRIAWNSKDDGDIKTSGQVTFMELPRGEIQVTVTMKYEPHPGIAHSIFNSLFGNLDAKLENNLHSFKEYAEQLTRVDGAQ